MIDKFCNSCGHIFTPVTGERICLECANKQKKIDIVNSTVALRYNEGKPQFDYILHFPTVVEALSRIFEHGAAKYDEFNWKKGGNSDRSYLASAMRHLYKWVDGEVFDSDSGCTHLGHVIWNLMVLLEINHKGRIMDTAVFKDTIERLSSAKKEK